MMNSPHDVIGAPVALKGLQPDGSPHLNISDPVNIKGGYQTVKHVGNAAMMLSRKAVTSLIQYAIQNNDVYTKTSMATNNVRQQANDGEYYDVFKVSIDENKVYLSEDYHVCKTLIQLGYQVVIDPRVKTRHNGNHVFLS
jgi:Flp pilus assembly protein TadG